MDKITRIHDVEIPQRLQADADKAFSYAAGYIYAKQRGNEDSIPDEVRSFWEKHGQPDSYKNVRDPTPLIREYNTGFIVGGGSLGSQPLPERQRISTRKTDNKPFRRT